MMALALAAAGLATIAAAAAAPHRPNIVLFLTDDLDLMLGGMDPVHQPTHIPALRARGAEVSHWYARPQRTDPPSPPSGTRPTLRSSTQLTWRA